MDDDDIDPKFDTSQEKLLLSWLYRCDYGRARDQTDIHVFHWKKNYSFSLFFFVFVVCFVRLN